MPLSDFMIHSIVYWPPLLPVRDDGQVQFATPIQLCGRWVNESETFMDRDGNAAVSRAKVRLIVDVLELGVLWFGKLADLSDRTNPFAQNYAWEIRRFAKKYNRDGDQALRIAYL